MVWSMSVGSHAWSDPPADLIITGGHVITVDPQCPTAEAIAVRGDRIIAVGTATEIARHMGPNTRVLSVTGQTVVPGFIEGHGHFVGLGESLRILDCSSARTWDELVEQVAAAARNLPPGTWVFGRGWHQDKWQSPPVPAIDGTPTHECAQSGGTGSSGHALPCLGTHVHCQRSGDAVGGNRLADPVTRRGRDRS